MPSFTFEGFTIGTPVDLSATQGAGTVTGAVTTWGDATPASASIDIASSETITNDTMTMVQHDSARFVPTGWVDFDTPETHAPSGNIYKPRFHDIVYFWDTGKTGDFSAPEKLFSLHKSRKYAHGPVVCICYENVGTYLLRLYAYEMSSGKFAVKTITINVVSADSEYPGLQTICINRVGDGNFSAAPAGATLVNADTFDETHSEWAPGGLKKRYLFKGGSSFTVSISMNRSAVTSGLMFGSYGTGKATLNIPGGDKLFPTLWREDATPKRVLLNRLNIDGGHRIATNTPGAAGICIFGSGSYLVFSECTINGFESTCLNLTDGATDPQGPCYFHLNDCIVGPDLSAEYPILTRAYTDPETTFAATGCRIYRSPLNSYDDTGNRSVIRLNHHQWCYLQACDIYNLGNSFDTQPPLKLGEQGDIEGGVYSVQGCNIEGGAGPAMLFKHNRSSSLHSNLICRATRFASICNGSGVYDIVSVRAQGASFDSCIVEALSTAGDYVGEVQGGIYFRTGTTAGAATTFSPNYVRNCTIVNHRNPVENNNKPFNAITKGGLTADWIIVDGSNIIHDIGFSSTPEAPLADDDGTMSYRGTGRMTGGSYNTSYAATPADAHSWRPETGSAALGGADAVFYPFPYDAQTETDMRPQGSEDRGAWQASA